MRQLASFLIVSCLVLSVFGQYATKFDITLKYISTTFTNPIDVDYHEPTNSLLMTANYYNGLPYNFETIDFSGSHYQFSAISGLTDEIYMASVRSNSFQTQNGWTVGEFFTGNGVPGQISRISADGSQITSPWVSLDSSFGLLRGALKFDSTGIFNGDLLVVGESGIVYRINSAGVATLLFAVPDNLKLAACTTWHIEGMLVVPNDVGTYGGLAGKVLLGAQYSLQMLIWDPTTGNLVSFITPFEVEDFQIIPSNENLFGIAYASGQLVGAQATDFAGYEGKIICIEEPACHAAASQSGLWILEWDSASSAPLWSQVGLTAASVVPANAQWEGFRFAPAGVLEILPPDPICYQLKINETTRFNLSSFALPNTLTAPAYYDYKNSIANIQTPAPESNTILVFFGMDYRNLLSLFILVDSVDGTGGTLSLNMDFPTLDVTKTFLQVQDDPTSGTAGGASGDDSPDNYVYQDGGATFQWTWGPESSDGTVISPLDYVSRSGFCLTLDIIASTGIDYWKFVYPDANGQPAFSPLLDLNSSPQVCVFDCTKFCFLFTDCYTCTEASTECTYCSSDQTCYQSDSVAACNATYTQGTCPCDQLTDECDKCNSNANCGWCCSGQGNLGSCLSGAGASPDNGTSCFSFKHSCESDCSANPCVHGTCVCGSCVCPRGYGGVTCNETYDCAGVLGGPAKVDVCGICNGNGTTCIGCDGTIYGPKYDACGICGGNGTTCFHQCELSCDGCVGSELCDYCISTSKCVDKGGCASSSDILTDKSQCDKPVLTTAAIAGITAGAIAAIVVGAVVGAALIGFGSKKGWDYYQARRANINEGNANPLYKDPGNKGTNPFYA